MATHTVKMAIDKREEIFTHHHDDGTFRHFPVNYMFKLAEEYIGRINEIVHVVIPLTQRQCDHIREKMGIEQDRIDRLAEPYLSRPLVGIFWDDNNTLTIIDGNHRYIKLFESGVREARCHIFKHPFWEKLLLPLPNDAKLLTGRSGVIEQEQARQAQEKTNG